MNRIEERRSCVRSGEMPAVIWSVSITIPKKVSWVDRASIFKPGERRPQAGAPGFLKLFLCERLYVCVCVRPRGY